MLLGYHCTESLPLTVAFEIVLLQCHLIYLDKYDLSMTHLTNAILLVFNAFSTKTETHRLHAQRKNYRGLGSNSKNHIHKQILAIVLLICMTQ